MARELITRDEARAKGLKRFFTGLPCIRNHISERYVSVGSCCECSKGYFKKWYDLHPEFFAEKAVRQRQADPEMYKRLYDEWVAANYERKLTHNRNRRAKLLNAGSHTVQEVEALLEAQNFLCANPYCGVDLRTIAKHLDHIVSLANDGSNTIDNLQWLCDPCNRRKSFLDEKVWLDREAKRQQTAS